MKKWKKWLSVGLAVVTLSLGGGSAVVNANPFEPYDRSEAVVLEERQRKKDDNEKPNPKAWQKINGVCYNGSGVAIPGQLQEESTYLNGREKLTGQRLKNQMWILP